MTTAIRKKRKLSTKKLIILLVFIGLAVFEIPSAVVFFFGMLPTIVVGLLDRDPSKTAVYSVGPMNLAGVVPIIVTLWDGRNSFQFAFTLLNDPMNWLVMYGAAAFGWLLYFIIPYLVAIFIVKKTEFQVSRLEKARDKLGEQWGIKPTPAQIQKVEVKKED